MQSDQNARYAFILTADAKRYDAEQDMQLIRCTAKLVKEMGRSKSSLVEDQPQFSYLGQWHANLVYIKGRKCILFANDRILVNFIVPDVRRAEIRELDEMFRTSFQCVLSHEAFPQDLVEKIMSEYSEIGIGKSNNRSVLGSLNDLMFHYEHSILGSGGPHSPEVPAIISRLNRMPMRAKDGFIWPIEELLKLYEPAS